MFGFIIPNFETLKAEEKSRYQSIYCGLCHSLRDNYSNISRLALSYDLTFLVLLLSSLYEPAEKKDNCNCIFHPGDKFETAQNEFSDYCADMTVALAYHKILDDINDENKLSAKISEKALRAQYEKVQQKHPEICASLEKAMEEIRYEEKDDNSLRSLSRTPGREMTKPGSGDKVFGMMLGRMFAPRDDNWCETLVKFGAHLGRLIYFMDAAVDYEADIKNGLFNPYREILDTDKISEKTAKQIKEYLAVLAGQATQHYEKLPLIKDANLLNNILYEGLWIQFNYKFFKEKR